MPNGRYVVIRDTDRHEQPSFQRFDTVEEAQGKYERLLTLLAEADWPGASVMLVDVIAERSVGSP